MFVASDDLPTPGRVVDHDQVARLQPRREVVEVAEPRRQPRVCRVPVLRVLQVHHGRIDQVAQDGHLVGILATGHVVDPLFRVIGHALGVLAVQPRTPCP